MTYVCVSPHLEVKTLGPSSSLLLTRSSTHSGHCNDTVGLNVDPYVVDRTTRPVNARIGHGLCLFLQDPASSCYTTVALSSPSTPNRDRRVQRATGTVCRLGFWISTAVPYSQDRWCDVHAMRQCMYLRRLRCNPRNPSPRLAQRRNRN